MTKRRISAIGLAAALLLSERAAFGSDTIWDLLRTSDQGQKKATPSGSPAVPGGGGPGGSRVLNPVAIPRLAGDPNAPAFEAVNALLQILRTAGMAPMRVIAAVPTPVAANVVPTGPAATPPTIWDLLRSRDPKLSSTALEPVAANPAVVAAAPEPPGTIWDLMRSSDPGHPNQPSLTLAQAVRNGQPTIDPRTGRMLFPAAAPHKPRTGVLGFFDSMGNTARKVGKKLNSEIHVTGIKTLGIHDEQVSGSNDSYSSDTYFGRRGVGGSYGQTDLTITGKIAGLFNFQTRYSDSIFQNPNDNKMSINYATKKLKFDAGDITGSIAGNSLVEFSRALKGVELTTQVAKGVKWTGLWSQTKAQTRTITITGNNTSGPYYVYAGQIVDGSPHVRVNNRDMQVDKDYTLDLYTGELKFTAGTIIQYTDVIAVTFETYGYNSSPGVISGSRLDLDVMKGSKLGFTYLAQTTPNKGAGSNSRVNQFSGFGNAATPYVLDYAVDMVVQKDSTGKVTSALPRFPMKVTIGGIPQVYGTDFQVDYTLPNRVFFAQPIPSTQVIRIEYVPVADYSTPGSRSILGADWLVPLGKTGSIVAEMATSKLDISGTGVSGSAMQVRGDMKFLKDRLRWNWQLRNIGDNFTAIESPGFNRNDRGFTTAFNWLASKDITLNATLEKSKRPSYSFSNLTIGSVNGFGQSAGKDDFTQTNISLAWKAGKLGTLNLAHNGMDTRMSAGGSSNMLADSLTWAYAHKALSLDMQLSRNNNSSATLYNGGTTGTTGTLTPYGSSSISQRLNMRWRASEMLSFNGVVSNSQISGQTGQSTTAQDMSINTEIKPLKNMTLRLGYQMQNSGGISPFANTTTGTGTNTGTNNNNSGTGSNNPVLAPTRQSPIGGTGYYGGTGYDPTGYAGGGYLSGGYNGQLGSFGNYSGGLYSPTFGSQYGTSYYGGNARTISMNLEYTPFTNLNLNLTYNKTSSVGDLQFNSARDDIGITANYSLGERLTLTSAFTTQKVNYLSTTGGTTSTNMLFFNLSGRPIGKLRTTLGYSIMKTNSNLAFNSGATGGLGTGGLGTGGFGGGLGSDGSGLGLNGGYTVGSLGGSNQNSYTLRLEYPVFRGNSLFFQMDSASSTGYLASDRRTTVMGIDFLMTGNMHFSLGWRDQQNLSKGSTAGTSDYSYRVRSLDADVTWQFR